MGIGLGERESGGLTCIGESNVHTVRLYATQTEYEEYTAQEECVGRDC